MNDIKRLLKLRKQMLRPNNVAERVDKAFFLGIGLIMMSVFILVMVEVTR